MTICIAAICSDEHASAGRAVVVASDRMVTMGGLTEFEHEVPKFSSLTSTVVCLMSGDALRGSQVSRETAVACASMPGIGVEQVAEHVAQKYAQLRLQLAISLNLSPRGLTLEAYYGSQQQMLGQLVAGIDNALATTDFGLELLIAGVDSDGGHVFQVGNPGGVAANLAPIGFHAIGSGGLHAIQSMISFRHHPGSQLRDTVFRVFASKKRAEVAPGVGENTDLAIITTKGLNVLSDKTLQNLDEIYEEFREPAERRLQEKIDVLVIPGDGEND